MTIGTDATNHDSRAINRAGSNAESLLQHNLAAFPKNQIAVVELIRAAALPVGLEKTTGRDGTPTYCFQPQNAGQPEWLGPTTTPLVTANALLGKFDAGMGNALLYGIGDGSLPSALLAKSRAHQALFVVEPDAWRAKAALMLYDMAATALAGRLILCVGPTAWDQMGAFLESQPGYLPPERTLALPWIDAAQMRSIQQHMQALQQSPTSTPHQVEQSAQANSIYESASADDLEQAATLENNAPSPPSPLQGEGRGEGCKTTSEAKHVQETNKTSPPHRIAILSNSLAPEAHYLARGLETAAGQRESTTVFCSVPDRPECLHPHFVQSHLRALQPTHAILIDCSPQDLAVPLPDTHVSIVISHGEALSPALLEQLPSNAQLWLRSQRQQQQAIAVGMDKQRFGTYLPGVALDENAPTTTTDRFVVAGPVRVPSANDVGLNMMSHQSLWRACETIIAERIDSYHDDHAAQVLRDAERTLKIQIQSDDVRAGIENRVRQHLGPAVITARLRDQLVGNNLDITAAPFATFINELATCPVIWVSTSSTIHPALLRLVAASVPVLMRATAGLKNELGSGVMEAIPTFANSAELETSVSDWQQTPENAVDAIRAANEMLRSKYSWIDLLNRITPMQ